MPVLVAHFNEHTAENAGMSFWDFMVMHYASKRVFDSDYEKDMKLPFKVMDNLSGSTFLLVSPEACVVSPLSEPLVAFSKGIIPYDPLIDADFCAGIWQPPQLG